MIVETALAMVTVVCDLKRIHQRVAAYLTTRLAFVAAMFNTVLVLYYRLHPEKIPFQLSMAEFSL